MDHPHPPEPDQATLWNGAAGQAWVEEQALLDRTLQPFEDLLVAAVAAGPGSRVLDVGCGTGATTLSIARRLGARGRCTGVDVSAPMIEAARARVAREGSSAAFIRADAEAHAFEAASFDMIVSRFGVMFFADPVRAFANLRRAARPGAELRFVAWRSAAENPFTTTAERAAPPLVPDLPPRRADGPGQFAFADGERVAGILAESGWADVDVAPIDVACEMPEADLVRYLTRLGPLGRVLPALDEGRRAQVIATVRAAFEPFVEGAEVRFIAACWLVGARAR